MASLFILGLCYKDLFAVLFSATDLYLSTCVIPLFAVFSLKKHKGYSKCDTPKLICFDNFLRLLVREEFAEGAFHIACPYKTD